jgi:hypothetical protein
MGTQNKLQINIFNIDLEWLGMVDAVEYLVHRTNWHGISNSIMSVSKKANGVEHLQIGRILLVNNRKDKALIIEEMEASLNDNYWNFTLIPLKGILNYRIAHPSDSGSGWSNRRQALVMRELIRNNLVTQTRDEDRKFWNSSRTKNMLNMGDVVNFGDTISFAVDWETGYLGDTITDIANMYGNEANYPLGWNFFITEDFQQYQLSVVHGNHRTINQLNNPPVVFSEEFGNIQNATYTYSIKDWRNAAYMIWRERVDGQTERVTRVETVRKERRGQPSSFNRKEIVIHSLQEDTAAVRNEGQTELNKRPHIESFSAEIINNPNTMSTFEADWFLGDIVTVQSKEIVEGTLLSIDAQITEIEEVYADGLYSINATFGEGKLSVFDLIKNRISEG